MNKIKYFGLMLAVSLFAIGCSKPVSISRPLPLTVTADSMTRLLASLQFSEVSHIPGQYVKGTIDNLPATVTIYLDSSKTVEGYIVGWSSSDSVQMYEYFTEKLTLLAQELGKPDTIARDSTRNAKIQSYMWAKSPGDKASTELMFSSRGRMNYYSVSLYVDSKLK